MTITGISNRGLLLITILVTLLWGCVFAERAIVNKARHDRLEYLRWRGPGPVNYERQQNPRVFPPRFPAHSRATETVSTS